MTMRNLIVIAALGLAACKSTPPCEDKVEAFVISQTFIERQLRSPSTADFPSITDAGVSVIPTTLASGKCAFEVSMPVDAQNAFGGTVRQSFWLIVSPENGSWNLEEIRTY